jgi:hypothetical protein
MPGWQGAILSASFKKFEIESQLSAANIQCILISYFSCLQMKIVDSHCRNMNVMR